jgi:hypothetical protein
MGASVTGHIFFGVYFGEEDPRWPEGEYGREAPEDWDDLDFTDWENWLMATCQTELGDPYHPDIYPAGHPERVYARGETYRDLETRYGDEVKAWETTNAEWVKYRRNYWKVKAELVKNCPVKLITIGHYDYPLHVLIINGTEATGDYGCDPIPEGHFNLSDEKIREAVLWCEDLDLPFENPTWLIGGSYG